MSKDEKINLKLEVFKDKNSGKLSMIAHFYKTAPNIYKDKEDFIWAPTVEEKDFLYEAFKMIPEGKHVTPSNDEDSRSDEHKEITDSPKLENPKGERLSSETQSTTKDTKTKEEPTEEKLEKSSIFSASEKDTETEDTEDTKEENTQTDVDDTMLQELEDDELKTLENEEDKELIVEADSEAIDEALKKHSKNDDSIVEADEQTIIDKVLSQKKKGRWSRK